MDGTCFPPPYDSNFDPSPNIVFCFKNFLPLLLPPINMDGTQLTWMGPMTQGWNLPPPTFFYPISHLPHPNFPPPTSNFEKMTSHICGILRIEFQ